MLLDFSAERELYLIFQEECNYPGSGIFQQGFKHVFALERQALGWICIDPSRDDFHSYILPAGYVDDVVTTMAAQNPTFTIMQLFVMPQDNKPLTYPGLGLISCVAIIQYTLGIYWPLIVTPYQLYCRLSRGRINHIRVGKVWAGKVPSVEPMQQQRHHEPKRKTLSSKLLSFKNVLMSKLAKRSAY